MNERDKKVLANGDIGQGDYLVEAKQKNKKTHSFRWFAHVYCIFNYFIYDFDFLSIPFIKNKKRE